MLFLEPNATPYDLHWRMFGTSVRVHPMFWLVSLVMGWNGAGGRVEDLLLWVGCVFVSILIHELGHVWMGRAFGAYGHIVLYGFGGLAIGSNHVDVRWQRIAVCLAGPLAGFVFLGVLMGILWICDPEVFPTYLFLAQLDLGLPVENLAELARMRFPDPLVLSLVGDLIFINLMWGLVNLLPIWPLDGGQISRELCEAMSPESGMTRSLGISLVVAGLLAVHCVLVVLGQQLLPLRFGSGYTALLFALLAFQSFQLLQQVQARRHGMDEERWDDEDR